MFYILSGMKQKRFLDVSNPVFVLCDFVNLTVRIKVMVRQNQPEL